jgi:asparagine synthetase B (glutamine-hydrolysing)
LTLRSLTQKKTKAFMRGAPPPEANDAAWLLDLYRSFFPPAGAAGAGTEYEFDAAAADAAALESLAAVNGSFAFVIFDALHHRVFAARDAAGAQPLWWGATAEGSLMIGSCPEDLAECEPSATPFPAGESRRAGVRVGGQRCVGVCCLSVFGLQGETSAPYTPACKTKNNTHAMHQQERSLRPSATRSPTRPASAAG